MTQYQRKDSIEEKLKEKKSAAFGFDSSNRASTPLCLLGCPGTTGDGPSTPAQTQEQARGGEDGLGWGLVLMETWNITEHKAKRIPCKCFLSLYLGSHAGSVGSCWHLDQIDTTRMTNSHHPSLLQSSKMKLESSVFTQCLPYRGWTDLQGIRSNFVKASVLKQTQDVKPSFICYPWGRKNQDAVTFSFATGWTSSSTKWFSSTWEARQNV